MQLRILHSTEYDYLGSVDFAQHMVHLTPRDGAGQQVLRHVLQISPEPSARSETTDVFGNRRTFLSLQAPHERLLVRADSEVNTRAPLALPDPDTWVLSELSHGQRDPDGQRRWPLLAELLHTCEAAAGNLSDEVTRLHFSHADQRSQSLGA